MSSLTTKTLIQSALFPVVLGLVLFLSAWTLDYWEAWVYCLILLAAVMGTSVYLLRNDPALLERRLKGGESGETEQRQRIGQTVAGVLYLISFIIPGLDHRFHWSTVPISLSIAADVCVVLAFYIVFLVFKENSYTSSIIEVYTNQQVISTGPYCIVRHPMYTGVEMLFFATPIALGSFWALLLVIPLSIMIVLRLLDEERFLAEHLPGYTDYRQATRYRLIPFIW